MAYKITLYHYTDFTLSLPFSFVSFSFSWRWHWRCLEQEKLSIRKLRVDIICERNLRHKSENRGVSKRERITAGSGLFAETGGTVHTSP